MKACETRETCLAERYRAISYPIRDPRNYTTSPCPSCKVGIQRRMEGFKAEPDVHDTQSEAARSRHSKKNLPTCPVCRTPCRSPGATHHRACLDSTRTKTKVVKKPPTGPRTTCARGHSRAVYGKPRKDNGYNCRLCSSANKRKRYQERKGKG